MKFFLLALIVSANISASTELTDEMALEAGMTPLDEISLDFNAPISFKNRSNFVTTIPSLEDIQNVIKSHRQVILVNKASKGAYAQTLRLYENGQIKPIFEDGKAKEFVKISSGREKQEKAKSGRVYLSVTPKGFFRAQRVYTMYYSNTWKADMPDAVFFCPTFSKECGIAIHATTPSHFKELGTRASGGCVRTRPEVAKQIREFVMDSGLGSGEGRYSTLTEGYRRFKVTKNTVSVDNVERYTAALLGKVNSWDTVIVVYE